MKYKKSLFILLALSVVGLIISVVLRKGSIAESLFPFSLVIIITSLVLLFLKENIFKTWKKFALVYIPVGILLIIFTPYRCNAPLDMCFEKEIVAWLISLVYLIISLILIIHQSLKLRSKKDSEGSKVKK